MSTLVIGRDEKLLAWLDALSPREGEAKLTAYEEMARALSSNPRAIEIIYRTFIDATPVVGRAQMASEICSRAERKLGKGPQP